MIEPWGPPPIKSRVEEVFPFILTIIFRSLRKSIRTLTRLLLIPTFTSLMATSVGSTLSNAPLQSYELRMTASDSGLSRIFLILSTRVTIRCSVPTPFFPPYWRLLRFLEMSSFIHCRRMCSCPFILVEHFKHIFGKIISG